MKRRRFIQRSSAAIAGTLISTPIYKGLACALSAEYPDIAAATRPDIYRATVDAVDCLGGIDRFVKRGSSVGMLINSDFDQKGTYVSPDITLAALAMCRQAGASEIVLLQPVKEEYWKRSSRHEEFKGLLKEIRQVEANTFPAKYNSRDFILLRGVKGAKFLIGEVEIVRKYIESDVFINIGIGKHHSSTLYTGAMKNLMGVTTRKTNVQFHLGSGVKNDPEYLAQCIADLSLVRPPGLILSDSTEVVVTNGPSGPGRIMRPGKVVAGTDPVAMDAYGGSLIDIDPGDVLTTKKAFELGLGMMDLAKITIKELN